jgi:predicted phage tail protein
MGLINRKQTDIVLDKIKPLIQEVADKRVKEVMKEIQTEQISAYETFFNGQQERLEKMVNDHIDKRLRDLIPKIAEEVKRMLDEPN